MLRHFLSLDHSLLSYSTITTLTHCLSMEQTAHGKEFVLCFDGTGYRFRGDEADSNVLKIYRVSYSFINQSLS